MVEEKGKKQVKESNQTNPTNIELKTLSRVQSQENKDVGNQGDTSIRRFILETIYVVRILKELLLASYIKCPKMQMKPS